MIGLNNNPYLDYSKHVDTEYLETNKESVITAIANCDIESWGLTGSFCNVLESIDSKHTKVKNHKKSNPNRLILLPGLVAKVMTLTRFFFLLQIRGP